MIDVDTFLITVYVMADDFCKERDLNTRIGPGRKASLTRSETMTLLVFAQAMPFRSERDFYRYALRHLGSYFPNLPDRTQFNRQARHVLPTLIAFWREHVQGLLATQPRLFEIVDTVGIPVRNLKRRGRGWLAGEANIGWSTHLGWFMGFRALFATTPSGIITGFGFAPASAKDQPLANTFLAARRFPNQALLSVGSYTDLYLADTGFRGNRTLHRWRLNYDALILCKPDPRDAHAWDKPMRRWFSGLRQIVESIIDRMLNWFRLAQLRSHTLQGFHIQLAAKTLAHNICIWFNLQLGRPPLAFADLIDW
jgi:hypothetical protein